MKLRLVCVGKLSEDWQKQACADYSKRLKHRFTLDIVELKEEKGGRRGDTATLLHREGQRILDKISAQDFAVVLDETGRQLTSVQLADTLGEKMLHGAQPWCLIIGGPYGLDPQVKQRANLMLSLSKLTLTHQMARLFLLEQLYRGSTILRNEPYHNP
ncbi:MAG: 23S rRNA (pseudouridine(1915)-N(3))-methyltransferase RlmH [Desulfuromonas sp.]|nr:MAG: 23S rRNA (pseudouridine(1915)-N(3))-methyltransferase RlmH [Desulfuromonas sp.]